VRDLACVWIPLGGLGDLGWWKHHGGGGDGGGGGGAVKRRSGAKQCRADTMVEKRLDAERAEQDLRAQIVLEEATGSEAESLSLLLDLSLLLNLLLAQTAALSTHFEETGEEEDEKEKEEEEKEEDMWWSEEEYEEEEEVNEFELEPEELEEQSKLAVEKGQQFRVYEL
jgi:hypothetical protein